MVLALVNMADLHFFYVDRKMYWINSLDRPLIQSAYMNGFSISSLVSRDLEDPSGLTIDYHMKNRIFWTDLKRGIIESVKPDGSDRVIAIQSTCNFRCLCL